MQSVHAPSLVLQGKVYLYVKSWGFNSWIVLGWSLLDSFSMLF